MVFLLFVGLKSGDRKQEMGLLHGNYRCYYENVVKVLRSFISRLRGALLFGIIDKGQKYEIELNAEDGPANKTIIVIKNELKDMLIAWDLCLCSYTYMNIEEY